MSVVKETLNQKIQELSYQSRLLEFKRDLDYLEQVHKIFSGYIDEKISITVYQENIYFHLYNEEDERQREIFQLRIEINYKDETVRKISPSVSSMSGDAVFTLFRIAANGQIAKVLINGGLENLQVAYNKVTNKRLSTINKLRSEKWELERKVKDLVQEEKDKEREKFTEKILKGYKLDFGNKYENNPNREPILHLKNNGTISGIREVEVTRVISSGKSLDLRITYVWNKWVKDGEIEEVSEVRIFDKVKMNAYISFSNEVKDYMIE